MDRVPLASSPTWAHVVRPATALVYLDLNHFIELGRLTTGKSRDPQYSRCYQSLRRAVSDDRAIITLSASHAFEMLGIKNPAQRATVAAVMEQLGRFLYLLGSPELVQLEFEAGVAAKCGEKQPEVPLPLLRETALWAHGHHGRFVVRDEHGADVTDDARMRVGPERFDQAIRDGLLELERNLLRGPTDEEAAVLREKSGYRPESAMEARESRLNFELETSTLLDANPSFRKGRLRDFISAREVVHEWLPMINRVLEERILGRKAPIPSGLVPQILAGMPCMQVAITMKTRYHRNPHHAWTVNDITDIDALSVAYAYCDCVFTDRAARGNLASSTELRSMGTFLPRTPSELPGWLDDIPQRPDPRMLLPAGMVKEPRNAPIL